MYIYNGQPIDITVGHVINDIQYGPGYFFNEEVREALDVIYVPEPAPPQVGPAFKAVLEGFKLTDGQWSATWRLEPKTAAEIAADAQALEEAKAIKRNDINIWRSLANQTTFPHLGELIQCDPVSRSDIDGVANHIALHNALPEGFPGGWKTLSNTFIPMPEADDFRAMYHSMTKQGTANFAHSQALKARVAAATSIAELDAIVW